jgi:transcriptional regulator with XRE-family HTH domain
LDTAEIITVMRERAGITRHALSQRLGVSPQLVINWEEGRNCPTADTLIAVCRELGFELIVKERYTNGMYTTEPQQEGKH